MKQATLSLLACPVCHGPLEADGPRKRVICNKDKIAFAVHEGIARLVPSEAVPLDRKGDEM